MTKIPKTPILVIVFAPLFALLFSNTTLPDSGIFHSMNEDFYHVSGRTFQNEKDELELISAASQIEFISSKKTDLLLYTKGSYHAYVSIWVNGIEMDKYTVGSSDTTRIVLDHLKKNTHIKLIKDTEASTGVVVIKGIEVMSQLKKPKGRDRYIEFIGNSITSAMGADTTDVPCGVGKWYDQHRASYSYGKLTADGLKADVVLNSVSGYGIYRNWNDENIDEPTLPQVYDNLYLNQDRTIQYQPKRTPDLISICLGTNDLSRGDGIKTRLPFNFEKYVKTYTSFVQRLYDRDPDVKIVLLTSPMVGGNDADLLKSALNEVKSVFREKHQIAVFEFRPITPTGCTYHPLIPEQKEMARQLVPFLNDFLNQ
ncbi:MAG: GDSL-type esterase/lipase family protein [Bacteroidota bacterium]